MSQALRSKASAQVPTIIAAALLLLGYLMGDRSVSDTSSWSGIGYAIVAFTVLFLTVFMIAMSPGELPRKQERKIALLSVLVKFPLGRILAALLLATMGDHNVRFLVVVVALIAVEPAGNVLRGWSSSTVLVTLVSAMAMFGSALAYNDMIKYVDSEYIYIGIGTALAGWLLGYRQRGNERWTDKSRRQSLKIGAGLALLLTGMAIPAGSFDTDWSGAVVLGVAMSIAHVPTAWLAGEKTFEGLAGHRNGVWSLVLGICFEVVIPGSALIVLIAVVTSNVLRVVLVLLRMLQLKRRAAREAAVNERDDEESATDETDVPRAGTAN